MVSAIITTYKREPTLLLRALDSVLAQTYHDIEIIVVDDSPPDYPFRSAVCSAVKTRQRNRPNSTIKYIAHPQNLGACAARNTGLKEAVGEYVAYLDDDDEWLPDKIEKQVHIIQNSDAALVYCGNLCKNDQTGSCVLSKREYIRGNAFIQLLYNNFIASTSYPLIRRDHLVDIGGFDPLMQSAQDYDVWLRLAERYTIDYVAEPLVLYHEHDGERITTNPQRIISGLERINQKYKKYLDADRKLWWKRHTVLTWYYALNGEKRKALSIWWNCVCKYPENIFNNIGYFCRIIKAILFY